MASGTTNMKKAAVLIATAMLIGLCCGVGETKEQEDTNITQYCKTRQKPVEGEPILLLLPLPINPIEEKSYVYVRKQPAQNSDDQDYILEGTWNNSGNNLDFSPSKVGGSVVLGSLFDNRTLLLVVTKLSTLFEGTYEIETNPLDPSKAKKSFCQFHMTHVFSNTEKTVYHIIISVLSCVVAGQVGIMALRVPIICKSSVENPSEGEGGRSMDNSADPSRQMRAGNSGESSVENPSEGEGGRSMDNSADPFCQMRAGNSGESSVENPSEGEGGRSMDNSADPSRQMRAGNSGCSLGNPEADLQGVLIMRANESSRDQCHPSAETETLSGPCTGSSLQPSTSEEPSYAPREIVLLLDPTASSRGSVRRPSQEVYVEMKPGSTNE